MNGIVQYIHLEGMDLAGKTSVCRALMQALGSGWSLQHNRLCSENPVHELADRLRREGRFGEATLGQLYVAALAADLEAYTPPAGNTIQDSTILLRSLAYHTDAGTPHVEEALRAMLPRHPRFTLTVVLTADRSARLNRLEQRLKNDPDDVAPDDQLVVHASERFFAMERVLVALAQQHFNAEVIDTSSMSTKAVVEKVLANLASKVGRNQRAGN